MCLLLLFFPLVSKISVMEIETAGGISPSCRRDCPGGVVSGPVPAHVPVSEPDAVSDMARTGASASARAQPVTANPPPADLNPSSCLRSTPEQRFSRSDAMLCDTYEWVRCNLAERKAFLSGRVRDMGDRQSEAPESGLYLTRTEDREYDVYREMNKHEAVRSETTKSILLNVKGSSEVSKSQSSMRYGSDANGGMKRQG